MLRGLARTFGVAALVLVAFASCSKATNVTSQDQACGRGEFSCNGDQLQRCRDDGLGFDGIEVCDPGGCVQGQSECQKPGSPAIQASDSWVPCPGGSSDRSEGDPPCKPVKVSAGPRTISIDPVETTRAQYLRFTKAMDGKTLPGLPVGCSFKSGHAPQIGGWPLLSESDAHLPATGTDWCDAWAYCRWAGKRLCGKPGGGGAVAYDEASFSAPAEGKRVDNEWSLACNGGGAREWSFGATWNDSVCATKKNNVVGTLSAVGSHPDCRTPEGLLDMNGNVHERIDSCTEGKGFDDKCMFVGGAITTWGTTADCGGFYAFRGTRNDLIGFRCCADTP